jgi:hypothetical protein
VIITSAHLRSIPYFSARRGFCVTGARAWFARHKLDWRTFMRDGLPEETLLATGDAFAIAIVKHAHGERRHGQ